MSDKNLLNQLGNFTEDAGVDTTIDSFVNQGVEAVCSHIPGGETEQQMLTTEVDQVVNNDINTELNMGIGEIFKDLEGLF